MAVENPGKLHVVLSNGGTYKDVVDYLVMRGAGLSVMSSSEDYARFKGKWTIVREMLSLKPIFLRGSWSSEDTALLIGWQALPVLALMKMGLLARPSRCVVMGCFVHSQKLRKVVNAFLRFVRFPGLGFVVFSRGEQANLFENVGVDPREVLIHLWRQELYGKAAADRVLRGAYVFSGGFTNRDYNGLLKAAEKTEWPLLIVASERNEIDPVLCQRAKVLRDLPEEAFESKLAASALVALPLMSAGEACGQSVLLRVLRNRKALVANRHESIEDYLGKDYPGFVPAGDCVALVDAVSRALADAHFYDELVHAVSAAQDRLEKWPLPGAEIYAFLVPELAGESVPAETQA